MCALQAQLAEATEKADEAKSQVDKLETNLQETSRGTLQCCCSWLHVATTLEIQTRTPHRDFAFFSLSRSSLVLFVSANKELTQQYQELKAENLKQQKEAKTLQEELDKQVDKAAEASAAATTMEIEVQKLLAELEEQGVQHSNALSQATAEMKTLLDEQSAEAVSAKEQYEKVQAEKRRLRDEMDKQIAEAAMKAAEAQAMTDKVISELAQAKAQNDEYQRAIQEIAALAATMTKTNEPTSLG